MKFCDYLVYLIYIICALMKLKLVHTRGRIYWYTTSDFSKQKNSLKINNYECNCVRIVAVSD